MARQKKEAKKADRAKFDRNGNPIVPKAGKRAPRPVKDEITVVHTKMMRARYFANNAKPISVTLPTCSLVSYDATCKECASRGTDGFCPVKGDHRAKKAIVCGSYAPRA